LLNINPVYDGNMIST